MRHPVGWHLGNVLEITEIDWRILETVPPAAIVFLAGERIGPREIERILRVAPGCHVLVRGYLDPNRLGADRYHPDYQAVIPTYIEDCKRWMDEYRDVIPAGQRHFLIFNEQNMPVWSQWEGFGDWPEAMQAFDQWYCYGYRALKAHDPSWLIPWTPLTPGNRDVWFPGDAQGVPYYLHGPQAAKLNPTDEEIRAAIRSGPCYQSLMLADEFACHIYSNDPAKEPVDARWGGLRFVEYQKYLPKPMQTWITECGVNSAGQVDGPRLLAWYDELRAHPEVKGTALWILGSHGGGLWYKDGQPRPEVEQLATQVKAWQGGSSMAYVKTPPIQLDGRHMSAEQFVRYIEGLGLPPVDAVFLHHTASRPEDWHGYETLVMLKNWYETRQWTDGVNVYSGWTAGPHFFVGDDGIDLFTDVKQDGVGVAGWNYRTRHLEMVGNYMTVAPHGKTLENTVAVLGIMLEKAGLGMDRLLFHREKGQTSCPGDMTTRALIDPLVEQWRRDYRTRKAGQPMDTSKRDMALRNFVYNNIGTATAIPLNRDAAFPTYARQHELGAPLTMELYDLPIEGTLYVAQGFAMGIVFAVKGDWANVEHIGY